MLWLLPVKEWSFNETLNSPFRLDFDAIVTFDANVTRAPRQDVVFEVMEADNAAYQDYIQEYVWNTSQMDIFYDVELVTFTARVAPAAAEEGGRRRKRFLATSMRDRVKSGQSPPDQG